MVQAGAELVEALEHLVLVQDKLEAKRAKESDRAKPPEEGEEPPVFNTKTKQGVWQQKLWNAAAGDEKQKLLQLIKKGPDRQKPEHIEMDGKVARYSHGRKGAGNTTKGAERRGGGKRKAKEKGQEEQVVPAERKDRKKSDKPVVKEEQVVVKQELPDDPPGSAESIGY